MVLETWVPGTHTVAEKKIEIEAKSKKLSTFLLFHNTRENLMVFSGSSFSSSMIKIFDLSFHSFMRAGRLVQEVAKDAMTLLVLFTERTMDEKMDEREY